VLGLHYELIFTKKKKITAIKNKKVREKIQKKNITKLSYP